MINMRLSIQIEGRDLEIAGWASLADPQTTEALGRGDLQVAGSYLWLSPVDITFYGPQGRRIRPVGGVLGGSRLLLVGGLECTLKPLPEG